MMFDDRFDLPFDNEPYDPAAWPSLEDPQPLDPTLCRRPTWTEGQAVVLADNRTWHLPVLSVALIYSRPALFAHVRDYFSECSRIPANHDWALGVPPDSHIFYHLHEVGRQLIAANYDTGIGSWLDLFVFFGDELALADFNVAVSNALNEVAQAWGELHSLLHPTPYLMDDAELEN